MLLVALQGFQQMILAWAESLERGQRDSKRAKFKQFLLDIFQYESIISAHKGIVAVLGFSSFMHCLMCFFSYESSGPRRDFNRIFGEAPFRTGICLVIFLAIIIASGSIDK